MFDADPQVSNTSPRVNANPKGIYPLEPLLLPDSLLNMRHHALAAASSGPGTPYPAQAASSGRRCQQLPARQLHRVFDVRDGGEGDQVPAAAGSPYWQQGGRGGGGGGGASPSRRFGSPRQMGLGVNAGFTDMPQTTTSGVEPRRAVRQKSDRVRPGIGPADPTDLGWIQCSCFIRKVKTVRGCHTHYGNVIAV
jgi:hypothetical protein